VTTPLKILHIEDSEDDADLLALELRRTSIAADIERVDGREALCDALRTKTFDVILCDYKLPQLTGEEALVLVRNLAGSDVPVIFVSGGIGEETAVDLMRSGAQDYVLKDNLARLPVAIEREVEAARVRIARRLSEEKLDAERRLLHQVMESIPDAICFKDTERRYLGLNQAECRLLGVRNENEVVGKTADDFLQANKAAIWREEDEMVLLNGESVADAIEHMPQADGSVRWFSVTKAPLRNRKGKITGIVGISRDITERKQAEQMKDEFVATVSHELRTPLTSIAGSLSLLAGGAVGSLPDTAARLVTIAHANCERLVRLTNDILDIQRLEANGLDLVHARVDVDRVVAEAVQSTEGFAAKHSVTVKLTPSGEEAITLADPDRLTQVITNLLSNAIKFSPEGGEVTASVEANDDDIRITVRDHGPGIPESFRDRIFGKFAQVDASDSRQKGGTGLGLHIVKRIVDRLGGSIDFAEADGGGTIFSVVLPRVRNANAPVSQVGPRAA
jgi:PAS domain S-box-containing protein